MTTPTTPDRQDAQRTPLDMVKILDEAEVLFGVDFFYMDHPTIVAFARAIERAHGIGKSDD